MFRTPLVGALIGGSLLLVAACAPVKMGAAAIVGNQRVSTAQLDSEVSSLSTAAKSYGSKVRLPASAPLPGVVLTWMIRFGISDKMASDAGISVTPSEVQSALAQLDAQARQAVSQGGNSLKVFLIDNGIPPDMTNAVGRYEANQLAYAEKLNNGKLPTSAAAQSATGQQLNHAQCLAAKNLNIKVSPQFGRVDYTTYQVVATPDLLSKASGSAAAASTTGLAPSC